MKKSLAVVFTALFALVAFSIPMLQFGVADAATTLDTPNVTSISNGTNGVDLSWSKVEGATQYRVFYKLNGVWRGLGNTSETSFTHTSAVSDTSYTYTVRCVDSNGDFESGYNSTGWSIKYVAAPSVTSISNTTTGVTLQWNKVSGASKYRVFYNSNGVWRGLGNTTSTSYTHTSAVSGTEYTYTVRCLDSNGNFVSGYNSTGWSIKYVATPSVTTATSSTTGVFLEWGKVEGAVQYRVFYKSSSGTWRGLGNTTSTSWTDTDVRSGNSYTYTVRCIDSDGNFMSGYNSTGWSVKYIATPNVTNISNTTTGVKLEWDKVSGASQYRVFYKSSTGTWKGLGNTTSTSMVDTDVNSGSTYTYTIRCLDSDGNFISAYNTTGWKYTFIATPEVTNITSVATGVKIEWSAVKGASKYRVFYKGSTMWRSMGDTTSTSFIDTDVKNGNSYTYTVRCLDSDGNFISSYNSDGWQCMFQKPTLSTPQITGFDNDESGINITWSKVEGAVAYKVFILKDGTWRGVGTTKSTTLRDETNLSTTNTYTVRCVDDDGNFESKYDSTGWSFTYYFYPTLASAVEQTGGVKISWYGYSGVKYRVYCKTAATGWTRLGDTTNESYVHTSAVAGTTYTYTVRIISSDAQQFLSTYDKAGVTCAYKTTNATRDAFISYLASNKSEWLPSNYNASGSMATAQFIDLDLDGVEELIVSSATDWSSPYTTGFSTAYKYSNGSLTKITLNGSMIENDLDLMYNTSTKQYTYFGSRFYVGSDKKQYFLDYSMSLSGSTASYDYFALATINPTTSDYKFYKNPTVSNGIVTSTGTSITASDYSSLYATKTANLQTARLRTTSIMLSTVSGLSTSDLTTTLKNAYNSFGYNVM